MKIFVNGESIDCGEVRTVAELVERHQLSPATTLVEWNGVALHRRDWPRHTLQENDRIEVLRVAAGG